MRHAIHTARAPSASPAGARRCSAAAAAAMRRGMAVDSRHRSLEEMHAYLDSLFCLKGQLAVVTGAGGAVGKAACLALAK